MSELIVMLFLSTFMCTSYSVRDGVVSLAVGNQSRDHSFCSCRLRSYLHLMIITIYKWYLHFCCLPGLGPSRDHPWPWRQEAWRLGRGHGRRVGTSYDHQPRVQGQTELFSTGGLLNMFSVCEASVCLVSLVPPRVLTSCVVFAGWVETQADWQPWLQGTLGPPWDRQPRVHSWRRHVQVW